MNIEKAIYGRQLLSFVYDGFRRTVEPHTYGTDAKGHLALRAYQVGGGSDSGEHVGWKLFHVHEMLSLTVQRQSFANPRPGYKRGDKAFAKITAEL
jgi:hypothetical protein